MQVQKIMSVNSKNNSKGHGYANAVGSGENLNNTVQNKIQLHSGAYGKAQMAMNNAKNPNFGVIVIDDAIIAILIYYGILAALGGALWVGCYVADKVDEANRKKAEKKLEEEQNKEIVKISNSLNISFDKAKDYHNKYLSIGAIKPTKDGHEKGMNAVMGYYSEKYELMKEVIVPVIAAQKNQKIADKITDQIPNGIVMYGPPGTGKTYIAQQLGEHLKEFGSYVKDVELNDDPDAHDENAKLIKEAFEEGEKRFKETGKYTLLSFGQDIDTFFMDRNKNDENMKEVRALLKYADKCAERGVIWVGTANNPKWIDPAILRAGRTDKIMPVGKMEKFEAADMIKYSLFKHDLESSAKSFDYQKVVDKMAEENMIFTPSEIEKLVIKAKSNLLGNDKPLTSDVLLTEMRNKYDEEFPTLDAEMIEKYKEDQKYINNKEYLKNISDEDKN